MSDLLVDLSARPWFRQAVKQLGLPLPTPQALRRPKGPRVDRPLEGRVVVAAGAPGGQLTDVLARTLAEAGATPHVVGEALAAPWTAAAEAWSRPVTLHAPDAAPDADLTAHGLVFDATGLRDPAGLRALYDLFHPWLPALGRCGRIIVIGRPAGEADTPAAAAAMAALEGFVRSLAKEIGRKGATAHVVSVGAGAEPRLPALLRFLLSDRAAFLSGQPWRLSATVDAPATTGWTQPLAGQTVLLTGAARGIGAATAELLAAEGAHVICLDRPGDEGPLGAVARAIGGTVLAVDITADDAPEAIVAHLNAHHGGRLDAVIHNAGITRDKTLARMSEAQWDQAVAVNLGAVVDIDAALLAGPLAEGGRIVCLSSVAGIAGNVGQTNYAASKAGLVGYVAALAKAAAERNIAVNAVAPGFIETRLTAAIPAVTREVGRRLSALGQGGLPRDVGELITYLATPHSTGLTGQVIRACGGMFIGA